MRTEAREQLAELRADRLDVSKRDACGDEGDELLVVLVGIAMREADRVRLASGQDVATLADRVERRLHRSVSPAQARGHGLPRGSVRAGNFAARFWAATRAARALSRRTRPIASQGSAPPAAEDRST
jgi:hypothetical protein